MMAKKTVIGRVFNLFMTTSDDGDLMDNLQSLTPTGSLESKQPKKKIETDTIVDTKAIGITDTKNTNGLESTQEENLQPETDLNFKVMIISPKKTIKSIND